MVQAFPSATAHLACTMENNISPLGEQDQCRALPWFLAAGTCNTVFSLWTWGGSVFLLFLHALGLPTSHIGLALALVPLSGVLALVLAPHLTRWGWKRVFLIAYGTRKGVMALLLLLPWTLLHGGRTAGWALLFAVIVVFALLRAVAETAYYPWMQEFTPNRRRGQFTGLSLLLGTLASGAALLIAGQVLAHGEGWGRYQALMAAGCVAGLLGVLLMARVPGGAPRPAATSVRAHRADLRAALRDRNFTAFLGGLGAVTLGSLLLSTFLPLYLKDHLGIATGTVVRLDVATMAGGALAGLLLGWATDRVGSRPVLMSSAVVSLLLPLAWLLLPRQSPQVLVACVALYFLYGVAVNGLAIASGRLLFNRVIPPAASTAYTAIYYAWLGLTSGLAPLLAGGLLTLCGSWHTSLGGVTIDGYSLLFAAAILLLALGWRCYRRVHPDGAHTTRSALQLALRAAGVIRPATASSPTLP